jgi:hypothetical protein
MDPHLFGKLDPDPHSPKKLDPDPELHKVNADPKHCLAGCVDRQRKYRLAPKIEKFRMETNINFRKNRME